MVATRSEHVAFVILLSGPTVTVAQHNFWDDAADDENLTIAQLSAMLADFDIPPGDFDPRPFLEEMTAPGLWLFGDQDRIIPTRESARIVEELVEQSEKPFTAVIYANGDHGLRDERNGEPIDFWVDLLPWLESVVR